MDAGNSRRVALFGLLLALTLILGYIERLFPFDFGIPGVKLGLPNLVVLFSLYYFGIREAALISILRVLLSGLLFLRATAFFYSLAGAALSLAVMYLLKRLSLFGIAGVSVAGASAHNIGQVVCASFILRTSAVFFYLPALLIFGGFAGAVNGLLAGLVLQRFKSGGGY